MFVFLYIQNGDGYVDSRFKMEKIKQAVREALK